MEGVHRVHGVVGGDPGRAEAEVEEQDYKEEPGGSRWYKRGRRDFPLSEGVRGAATPAVTRGPGFGAAAPRIQRLQAPSHGAPNQADVEEEDGQPDAGNGNGD